MATVAALYVQTGGAYYGEPDVEPWDEARDARLYAGPHPVVAHPPCSRWCRLAGLVEARWGHKKGEDGGCFAAALASVRQWGGVLEHPAYSDAWAAFDLPRPSRSGGWQRGMCGGWSCHVEQGRYGHVAKKATWLYAHGVELPSLRWGSDPDGSAKALVSWCGNNVKSGEIRPRVGKATASKTPPRVQGRALRHGAISTPRMTMDTHSTAHKPDPDGVGRRIREARERHGWTVSQLALRCETSRQSVEAYEGGRTMPGGTMLARLSLALGVTADDILGLPRVRGVS